MEDLMMKNIYTAFVSALMVLLLSACGNVPDEYEYDDTTTLYLVDENDYSYANIPYICDSMREWSQTTREGAFIFIRPDTCTFDFDGLDGVYGDDDDVIVRIVDYTNDGKDGIPYDCSSFSARSTYSDGSFDYDKDDVCSFYL